MRAQARSPIQPRARRGDPREDANQSRPRRRPLQERPCRGTIGPGLPHGFDGLMHTYSFVYVHVVFATWNRPLTSFPNCVRHSTRTSLASPGILAPRTSMSEALRITCTLSDASALRARCRTRSASSKNHRETGFDKPSRSFAGSVASPRSPSVQTAFATSSVTSCGRNSITSGAIFVASWRS